MESTAIIEMIGYFGSALVLVSFLMASVVKLRVINSIGGLVFAVYALLIHSYPTALMNFCLVGINIYYLMRLSHPDRQYTLIEDRNDSALLRSFLDYYGDDISRCFPGVRIAPKEADVACFVCHNMAPAGLLLGKDRGDGVLEILLDYSTPEYRDCSVGKYLYARLAEKGMASLLYLGEPGSHEAYLKKMGFSKEKEGYVKQLSSDGM